MKRFVLCLALVSAWFTPMDAVGDYTLSRGRRILLNRGLQIQSLVMPQQGPEIPTPGMTDIDLWLQANFTTINFWQSWNYYNQQLMADLPTGTPWSRTSAQYPYLYENELPRLDNFVNFQYKDEQPQTQEVLDEEKALFADWKSMYPNAISHTNFSYHQLDAAGLASFMSYTEPDMIMFDFYPSFYFSTPPDPASRETWYSTMQLYRTAGLAGIDGTGAAPIPYAQFLANFRSSFTANLPSESFVRLQQNASWAFGYTFTTAFIYNHWVLGADTTPVMFDSSGDSEPNTVFDYVSETNRQSQNLGPALVRLVSTGIFMIPGSSRSLSGTGLSEWSAHAGTTTGYTDYLTSITPTVSQGGATDSTYDDILVGYLGPLLANNSDATFADGLHFMIVNGAAGSVGTGTQAGSLASASAQWYHLMFDFTGSDFDSLVRLSRDTGEVELVPLTYMSGYQYFLDLNLPGGTGDLFAFWNSSDPLPTISGPPPFLDGDANGDGVVSAGDYASVQANFGNTGAAGILGDANGDGVVSAGDYASVQANFGNTLPAQDAAIPEPATICLLLGGGLTLLRRWR